MAAWTIISITKPRAKFHPRISVSVTVRKLSNSSEEWGSTIVSMDIQVGNIVWKKLFRLIITPYCNRRLLKLKTLQAQIVTLLWIREVDYWLIHLIPILNTMLLPLSYRWETNHSSELNTEEKLLQAVLSTIFLLLTIRSLLNWIAQTVILKWALLQKQERCRFSATMSIKLPECLSTEGRYQA